MSKSDKKEINDQTSSLNNNNIYQSNQRLYNRIVEQNTESLEQAFDESKKSIDESIREARNQIPRYTKPLIKFKNKHFKLLEMLQKTILNIKDKQSILFNQYLPHIYKM